MLAMGSGVPEEIYPTLPDDVAKAALLARNPPPRYACLATACRLRLTLGMTQLKAPPRRVLVVDDNEDAANSLAMVLSLGGHETASVYTAADALERAASFKPDVVLLDIGLPGMDGYEVAQRLRELPGL